MISPTSRMHRIEALRRRLERTACPTYRLLGDIIEAVGPDLLDHPGERAARLRGWLESGAFLQIALALVEWVLPDWSVRRLGQENHVWWCAIAHRTMIDWGGEEEDESHEHMTLAVLKALLTVLCNLPDDDAPRMPTRPSRRAVPATVVAAPAPAGRPALYGILIKLLGAPSRSFMRQVK